MPLTPGTRLGAYEIVAPIGAGGMGEVYRARDARLGRDVAIKILPASFAADPERLQRFEIEAKAAGQLNHPNVLTVYDLGTHDGAPYLVAELLEGETLRGRLSAGALPTRKALDYAVQTARGLAAAHDRSIVHRDLKPENLFVTRDGRVKILDFGLARVLTPGGAETQAATALQATNPGTVMGTVGYMSPEQVRGQPVDHRTDIFSFGAVLYEMLTGRRAFQGDSQIETMNAILKEDPPEFSGINPNLPSALDRIVGRCLEKNAAERFHSAHDLGIALDALSGTSSHSSPTVAIAQPASSRRRLMPAVAGAVVLLAVAAAFVGGRLSSRSPAPASPEYQPLTFRRGSILSHRLAPDGRTIVYSAEWEGKPRQLFSTRVESPESLPLPFGGADVVAISSTGELALIAGRRTLTGWSIVGTLARAPMSGGASRDLLTDVGAADWLPDGSNLVVSRFAEGRYRLEFPIGKSVYETGGWISDPRVSPDGQFVAFLDHPILGDDRGSAAVIDRAGKRRTLSREYSSAQGLAWAPSGQEVWYTGAEKGLTRALFAATLTGAVRTVTRAPANLLLGDIGKDGSVLLERNSLRRGIVVKLAGDKVPRDLSWFDWSQPQDLSEDGTTLLIGEEGDGGGPDYSVYLRKTDGSPAVRLGSGDGRKLSPDGKWVVTLRLNPAPVQLMLLPTGAGEARQVSHDDLEHLDAAFTPDGKQILFNGFAPGRTPRTFVQDLAGGAATPVTPEGTTGLTISPDGKDVVARDDAGVRKIYSLTGGAPRTIAGLAASDRIVRWMPDGRGFYIRRSAGPNAPTQVLTFDLASGRTTLVQEIPPFTEAGNRGGIGQLLLTPDGRGYVYGYGVTLSDLYLVKGLK